jgi:hypothetical protein
MEIVTIVHHIIPHWLHITQLRYGIFVALGCVNYTLCTSFLEGWGLGGMSATQQKVAFLDRELGSFWTSIYFFITATPLPSTVLFVHEYVHT